MIDVKIDSNTTILFIVMIVILIGVNVSAYIHSTAQIAAIHEEMRDFHNAMHKIEERIEY